MNKKEKSNLEDNATKLKNLQNRRRKTSKEKMFEEKKDVKESR